MTLGQRFLVVLTGAAAAGVLLAAARPAVQGKLLAAFDAEFYTRPDGYQGLCEHYGFRFPASRQMDPGLMYKAAADGAVDVINAFSTDGRIDAFELVVLEDDRKFFPPYYAAPLIRRETLEQHPQLENLLNSLAGTLSDATMRRLNYAVDEHGEKASTVARRFLVRQGLISADAKPARNPADTVTVGGKQFTEQEILGEMVAALIESHTALRVDRRLNLGGTMICFNAVCAGDVDLYVEYTGTGLVSILERKAIADPDASYAAVNKAFGEKYDLVWLKPFGFDNTYTLTMRRGHADRLGIETISDLADYLQSE